MHLLCGRFTAVPTRGAVRRGLNVSLTMHLFPLLLLAGVADSTMQQVFQGLTPAGGGGRGTTLYWVNMTYPENVTACSQVSMADATGESALGAWDALDLHIPLSLAGKNYGDYFYGYLNTKGDIPNTGACCADTMRIWSKQDGSFRDIDLVAPLEAVFPGSVYDYSSHTFELSLLDGELVAFMMTQFNTTAEDGLNGALVDVVVALSMEDGTVKLTADGKPYFSLWEDLGTLDPDKSVYGVQFTPLGDDDNVNPEEWHGNGVDRFTAMDGTAVLTVTHRNLCEAILVSDPWVTPRHQGGGGILQRFGMVSDPMIESHVFGLDGSLADLPSWTGVHNAYYTRYEDTGTETVTIFVNGYAGGSASYVYEFEVKLVPELSRPGPAAGAIAAAAEGVHKGNREGEGEGHGVRVVDDSVFATTYRTAACPFLADAQGGARPIGSSGTAGNGVWVVGSGVSGSGLVCVDQAGGSLSFPANGTEMALYDSFTFFSGEQQRRQRWQ